jgi:hypothetical protein
LRLRRLYLATVDLALLPALTLRLLAHSAIAARAAHCVASRPAAILPSRALATTAAPTILSTLSVSRSDPAQHRCGHQPRQHHFLQHVLRFPKGAPCPACFPFMSAAMS